MQLIFACRHASVIDFLVAALLGILIFHANRVRGLQASLTLRVSMEGSHGASQFGCDRGRSDHYGTY